MKFIDVAHILGRLGLSLGLQSQEHSAQHIEAPTADQRARGLLAFRRIRAEAQKMKALLSEDEIVATIRAGRR